MEGKIPDFGRGSIDRLDQMAKNLFKKKDPQGLEAKSLINAKDSVDLSGVLEAAEPEPAKKKWTVLFYMDGNNNLYAPIRDTLKGLESVGSNRDVNLVAEIGANPGEKTHGGFLQSLMDKTSDGKKILTVKRYYVTKDTSDKPDDKIHSTELADLGEQDMGVPKTVSDFLDWGIKTYPAEHYAVVLFDHGAGFAGLLSDEKTGHLLNINDLKSVVDGAAKTAGQKLDLVDFDACLMAQTEVADAIKEGAKFMVASEETERGAAQPLDRVMKDLQEGSKEKAMDPADLAKLFVYESFHQPNGAIFTSTLSAVDLEKIDKVVNSTDKLAQVLMAGNVAPESIRKDVDKSQHFCQDLSYKIYNDYHDLGHFAKLLSDDPTITDQDAKKAAQDLLGSMKEAVIANEHQGEGYKDSSGLSTYAPTNYGFDPHPKTDSVNFSSTHNYEGIPYAKDSHWVDLVKYISKDSSWHNFLKSFGMSKEGIDKLDGTLKSVGGKASMVTKFLLGASSADANYEAYQAMRHAVPKGFFGLGGAVAAKIGMLGGAYSIFKGVKGLYDVSQKGDAPKDITDVLMNKKTQMINAGIDTAEGVALTAVNVALFMGLAAGITTTAGIVAFALPVAKIIYDVISIRKNLKEKAEEMQHENPADKKTIEEKLKELKDSGGHLTK